MWTVVILAYWVTNMLISVVPLWLQEPTKNKTGNGKNGGKDNLDNGDEVGQTTVVFTGDW